MESITNWETLREGYERAVATCTSKLEALENSLGLLRSRVRCMENPHLLAADLVLLVEWKLTRGKMRPNLLSYARSHSDDTVLEVTTRGFAAWRQGSIKSAIDVLCQLKGVGPATASAILSLLDDQVRVCQSAVSTGMDLESRGVNPADAIHER